MAQEFTIKSDAIEDKINQLLPSQGGFGAGVDFSASTMVIPIVDLTESAEGSSLRQDLQSALSHDSATTFDVTNATTTIVTTTGYWRVIGTYYGLVNQTALQTDKIILSDGTTDKTVVGFKRLISSSTGAIQSTYDFIVKLAAGDSLIIFSDNSGANFSGSVRQLADVNGNLVNP